MLDRHPGKRRVTNDMHTRLNRIQLFSCVLHRHSAARRFDAIGYQDYMSCSRRSVFELLGSGGNRICQATALA